MYASGIVGSGELGAVDSAVTRLSLLSNTALVPIRTPKGRRTCSWFSLFCFITTELCRDKPDLIDRVSRSSSGS